MTALLLFGLIVGAASFVAIYGGNAEKRWLQRQAQRLTVERMLLRAIAIHDLPVKYRACTDLDRDLFRALPPFESPEGLFVELGDVVFVQPPLRLAIRVYRSATGDVIAYQMVANNVTIIALASYTTSRELETRPTDKNTRPRMRPEFAHVERVPLATPIDAMLAIHLELVRRDADGPLVCALTLDDAISLFQRSADWVREWRATQDPDALLEDDLRGLLGEERFAREGAYWLRRLKRKRVKLPVARAAERRPPASVS